MSNPSPNNDALTRAEIDFILWCIGKATAQPWPHAVAYCAQHEINVINKLGCLKEHAPQPQPLLETPNNTTP